MPDWNSNTNPDSNANTHTHPDANHYTCIVEGRALVWMEGTMVALDPGDVVNIPIGVLHDFGADTTDDITAAALDLDSSYLAVHGPPGTGKTHTAARVIHDLVTKQGWRVGVVAQSHATVETCWTMGTLSRP